LGVFPPHDILFVREVSTKTENIGIDPTSPFLSQQFVTEEVRKGRNTVVPRTGVEKNTILGDDVVRLPDSHPFGNLESLVRKELKLETIV
jgi:hypothetical protein